jgi:hypothetical protein
MTRPLAAVAETVGARNTSSGNIGASTRRSIATNAPAAIAATPSSHHSCWIRASASAPIATTAAACPGRASFAGRGAERGERVSSSTPRAPTGTLRKKIARQPTLSVSSPPTTGPAAIATPPPAAHTAIARARSPGSSKTWRTNASDDGSTSAAVTPCTMRAATSDPALGATPQATDDAVNPTKPAANARVAPRRSDSDPHDSSSAANTTT